MLQGVLSVAGKVHLTEWQGPFTDHNHAKLVKDGANKALDILY